MIAPRIASAQGFISVRRRYVDDFLERHAPNLRGLVLDLGGVTERKRGAFDIARQGVRVIAGNLVADKRPHVLCDAAALPMDSGCFDAVIAAELFEHLPEPKEALREIARTLRPRGTLLITVPFLYRIHGDPHDYARYTDQWWREALESSGFVVRVLERQGLLWSVLMDALTLWANERAKRGRPRWRLTRWLQQCLLRFGLRRASCAETRPDADADAFLGSFTTGFGIVAEWVEQ